MEKRILKIGLVVLLVLGLFVLSGCSQPNNDTRNVVKNTQNTPVVKEFVMTSFYDDAGIWFSLKEISVNKGAIVRIKAIIILLLMNMASKKILH